MENKKNHQMRGYLRELIEKTKEEAGSEVEVEVEYVVRLEVMNHKNDYAPQNYYDRLTTADIDEAYQEYEDTVKECKEDCHERFNREKVYSIYLDANVYTIDEDGEREMIDCHCEQGTTLSHESETDVEDDI